MRTSGIEDDQIDAREVKIKVYGFRLNSGLLLALFGIFVVLGEDTLFSFFCCRNSSKKFLRRKISL